MSLPAVEVSQSPESRFREFLASRPKPQRFTDPQREILDHVFAKHSHFDADQLIANLKAAGKRVSRATVYRTLKKLVEAGLLRTFETGSRTVYDHDYGYPEHEHLVCSQCGQMIEFQHPKLEEVLREVAAEHRFQAEGHTLVVRGVCAACNQQRAARRRLVM